MDPSRNFILKKGTFLTCVSYKNMISDPLLNLYFTSPAEAVFSLFRDATVAPFELSIGQALSTTSQRTNEIDDLYLNTFYLNEDLLINPLPDSNLERELQRDPNLAEVRDAIQADCQSSARDGFVIPYLPILYYQQNEQGQRNRRPIQIIGRITTYILCRQNLLLHTQSFRILKEVLVTDLQQLVTARAAENPQQRLTGGAIVEVLTRYLRENRGRVLQEVYVQPEIGGLASSPVVIPQIPPSSMLSPKDPSIFVPQQLSPGGTAYDAFATVPTDVLRVMALNMTLDALSKTCQTSQRFNQAICNSNDFWSLRTEQDFGRRNATTNTVMQRKPEMWTWKRYYAELSGNLPPNQILAFAELDAELLAEIDALPREAYEARVNEMRREAGLGIIDFERPEYQASRKASRQQPNVRRQLFPQPMVGPRVMGPVIENPNVGLMGEFPQPRAGFNMDFDGDAVPVQGRIIRGGGRLNVNQADMERIREFNEAPAPPGQRVGVFPIRGQRMNQAEVDRLAAQPARVMEGLFEHLRVNRGPNNQRNLQDLLAPLPADPADIRRLFASQEDYQDFFERYNPQPDIRQRARALRIGDWIPAHLEAAFQRYRNLIFAVRGAQLIAGNFRNEIFGQLFERAVLIGVPPEDILHQQILAIEQFMPDGDRWPQQSRQILMQQFELYVAEQRMNAQIQPAPAVGVPAAANVAPPGDLIDLHRLYINAIMDLDRPDGQQPSIDALARNLDERRGQQTRHRQLDRDIRNFRQYPQFGGELRPAQRARLRDRILRMDVDYDGDAMPIAVQEVVGPNVQNALPPDDMLALQRLHANVIMHLDSPEATQRPFMAAMLDSLNARRGQRSRVDQFENDMRDLDRYPQLGPGLRPEYRAIIRNRIQQLQERVARVPEAIAQRNMQPPQELIEVHRLYANLIKNFDQPQEIQQPGIEAFLRSLNLRRAQRQWQSQHDQFIDDMRDFEQYPRLGDGLTPAQTARIQQWLRRLDEAQRGVPLNIQQAQGRVFRAAQEEADRFNVPGGLLQGQQAIAAPQGILDIHRLYVNITNTFGQPYNQAHNQLIIALLQNLDARRGQQSRVEQFDQDLRNFDQYPRLGDQIRPLDGARLRGVIIAQRNGDQFPEEQIPEWLQETEILYRRLLDTNAPDYPGRIFEIVRNIDQRRGNESRREQLQTDIVTILRYPVLAENWPLVNIGQLRRILANVEQIGINPAFRRAQEEADRLDVPGGLLQRQAPIVREIPEEIRQRFYLYSALSEAIQAEDRQRIAEETQALQRDVEVRARANGITPINQVGGDYDDFDRYPLLTAGQSAMARLNLATHLRDVYELPISRGDGRRIRQ